LLGDAEPGTVSSLRRQQSPPNLRAPTGSVSVNVCGIGGTPQASSEAERQQSQYDLIHEKHPAQMAQYHIQNPEGISGNIPS
jgi:hypothetical protein